MISVRAELIYLIIIGVYGLQAEERRCGEKAEGGRAARGSAPATDNGKG